MRLLRLAGLAALTIAIPISAHAQATGTTSEDRRPATTTIYGDTGPYCAANFQ